MDWKRHVEENAARGSTLCPFSAKPAAGVLGAPGPVQQALAMKGTEKEEQGFYSLRLKKMGGKQSPAGTRPVSPGRVFPSKPDPVG